MTKGIVKIIAAAVFVFAALAIGARFFFSNSLRARKNSSEQQTRIIIPQNLNVPEENGESAAELLARQDSMTVKAPFDEGDVVVAVLNGNFDGSPQESQFVAYRNLKEIESPIYLTFISYDETARGYRRLWTAPSAATRPGTTSLFTQDLLGDRSVCVLLSGMNSLSEHTLTAFRLNPDGRENAGAENEYFSKIAELRIDGTITIQEIERPQAYQMGFGRGQSFTIAAYGRDFESANILDQVEVVYGYNTGNGLYEQKSRTRIPGSQIEQRRVRELLGNSRAFEEFITGLWYFTNSQGTIDRRQYIYFDPPNREIIFYGDETQQVFTWQNSNATRYGLYISSQNISVTTLRRSIDIELESLDSIRLRVFEDVRLKIGVNAPWDGSYRKAGPLERQAKKSSAAENAFIDAYYDGSMGKIHFLPDGSYELNAGGTLSRGKYTFFYLNDLELLEFRSEDVSGTRRETYLVEAPPGSAAASEPAASPAGQTAAGASPPNGDQPSGGAPPRKNLTLLRVRIGARGIERLHEGTISLALIPE